MQDQIISLETARLAQEKGFDIPQEYFYNAGSRWKLQSDSIIRTGEDEFIEAPTQSLLQKWLREVHLLDIVIDSHWADRTQRTKLYVPWVLDRPGEYVEDELPEYFPYYEGALESGLQEALNLLP